MKTKSKKVQKAENVVAYVMTERIEKNVVTEIYKIKE